MFMALYYARQDKCYPVHDIILINDKVYGARVIQNKSARRMRLASPCQRQQALPASKVVLWEPKVKQKVLARYMEDWDWKRWWRARPRNTY
ncbi:unnamed protein product [Lota lota]